MKKKLVVLFPLLFLVGCAQGQIASSSVEEYVLTYENDLPTVTRDGSNHTTYLMLSPYGRLKVNGEEIKGGDIPEKYYENCVAYKADPGETLPVAFSALDDVVFRGWYQYNNNIYPEKKTVVPSEDGQTYYAIFDGPTGGGGGIVTEGYGFLFSDGTKVAGTSLGKNEEDYDQYLVSKYTFTAGKSFALYDFSSGSTWTVDLNPWSFGGKSESDTTWKTYLSRTADNYTVLQTFTADVYIKLKYQADNVYFELK